ncbi:putative F-box protein At3g28280 [Henckelia pumila]|uniref:putative F-box protein At3g28280 n=1 Tax=Henckelia pumila TaxID=405737 RepID=UPI003C6DD4F6
MWIFDGKIDLAQGIVIEVLLRLPAAALCRFKVVSKEWHSMISSAYFRGRYASTGRTTSSFRFLSVLKYRCCKPKSDHVLEHELLMDLHSGALKIPTKSSWNFLAKDQADHHRNLRMKSYKVLGVSNGLVLCWCYRRGHQIICNPVTSQCVVLPRCNGVDWSYWGFLTEVSTDEVFMTSYTVVAFVPLRFQFQVFLSKTGEWKVYDFARGTHINPQGGYLKAATELHGILHWPHSTNGKILAYDPHRNPHAPRLIALPHDHQPLLCKSATTMFGTHQGQYLRYLESDNQRLSVWVLTDYGIGDNWWLQHRVDYDHIPDMVRNVHCIIHPISLHPFDPDIVYLGCDYVLSSYNMRERKWELVKSFHRIPREAFSYWSRAITLVIPPFPHSIPSSPRMNKS